MPTYQQKLYDELGNLISTQDIFIDPSEVNSRVLRDKAIAALASNQTYLGLATVTNAQVGAQVRELTKQVNTLIRLQQGQVSDISGT